MFVEKIIEQEKKVEVDNNQYIGQWAQIDVSCNGYCDDDHDIYHDNDDEDDDDEKDLGILHIQMVVYCLRHQHSQRWTNCLSLY